LGEAFADANAGKDASARLAIPVGISIKNYRWFYEPVKAAEEIGSSFVKNFYQKKITPW
jgi:hypothetical protein